MDLFQENIPKADNHPVSGSEMEIWFGLDREIGKVLVGPIRKYLGKLLGKVEAEAFFEVILREDGEFFRIFIRRK